MIPYTDRVYYNKMSYGKAKIIPLKAIYIALAILVPVIVPLPLALVMPNKFIYRYNTQR